MCMSCLCMMWAVISFFCSCYVCLVVYTTIYQPPNDKQSFIFAVYEEHVKAPTIPTLFVAVNLLTHPSHRTAACWRGILPSITLFFSEFALVLHTSYYIYIIWWVCLSSFLTITTVLALMWLHLHELKVFSSSYLSWFVGLFFQVYRKLLWIYSVSLALFHSGAATNNYSYYLLLHLSKC